MNKCDDCIQKITKPESCQQCAEHYQTKYMSAAPQFCPYCGYDHLVIHQDGTATCANILWMMSELISKTEQAAVSVPAIGKYMGMNNLYRNEKGNDAC